MKKTRVWVYVLSFILFSSKAFAEGETAPDFSLKDLKGNAFQLSDISGKVVILDFWATWCPPCQEEIPHFVELQKEYGSQGLQIVGVALDRRGARVVKPFAKRYKINYIILVGDYSKVIDDYGGIIGIPTTFVIDREGKIVAKYIGYVEKEEFERQIKKLL